MLVEKEVIRPGIYWYRDEATGLPRKLVVTPELCRYWHDQGNAMLAANLTVPVPCEHDFDAHPMTPAEKLKDNAGWVKQYRLRGDVLYSALDVTDDEIRKKLPHTIRWTSPWISSFTDGTGREWKNVISHLALTTRPRIVQQEPFGSVAAALSMANDSTIRSDGSGDGLGPSSKGGFCLSRAGRLFEGKKDKCLRPRYPVAFSLWAGGVPLAAGDAPPPPDELPDGDADDAAPAMPVDPLKDSGGDVKMEELLCDLLQALGVPMPDQSNEAEFKRHLYEAAMTKIKELAGKARAPEQKPTAPVPPPPKPKSAPNPLIQQEQQPMFMSLEEINKLPDPMKGVALAMHAENEKLRIQVEAAQKVTDSLRDAKLKEETTKRASRVALLGRLSPRVKADLEAMLAMPAMAMSMGEGGAVVDPMAQTLAVLERGLSDMPRLLTAEASAAAVQPQPTDGQMTSERADEIADGMARQMGCPPESKKAG